MDHKLNVLLNDFLDKNKLIEEMDKRIKYLEDINLKNN